MEQDQDRSPEWVLERFTPLLGRLKATVRHAPSRTGPPSPHALSRQPTPGAEVDIGLLNRMGYVQEGQILGAQLGWPRDWLGGSKPRLSFLIDLRSRPACAMFIVQDGRKTTTQLFWLQRVKVLFGRREFRFVCPTTGVRARALPYADGQLTPAPDRERLITKSDDPGRIQPTREVEVSTFLSVAQNVFDNPTRFTPDEADLVCKLLRQAASES